jgi:uncharacterized phosphosugar-binding protein
LVELTVYFIIKAGAPEGDAEVGCACMEIKRAFGSTASAAVTAGAQN